MVSSNFFRFMATLPRTGNVEDKAAAAVIAKALGTYPVKQSTAYAGDVTVGYFVKFWFKAFVFTPAQVHTH